MSDREEFEKWFKSTGYYYGPGFEYHKNTQKISWLACAEIKNAKIKELEAILMKACDYIHDEDEEGSICDEAYEIINRGKL